MSDMIKLLPDSVANQIAAGEVIQRPASVVKELVENSIDAGATSVQIILKDAGRTLIQVIDNGTGMSATDARLAFERHSTSKIRNAEDLFKLHTMGFRGEALASIAAISQLELRTRRTDEQLGTKLYITASKCESQEPDACPAGSNFMVKNLFFNVPARRKFLKSNQVELSNIVKEFEKLVLANPEIEFSLTHNGSLIYKILSGTFKQRIVALFGHGMETQLLPIGVDTSLVKIDGFISRPENARRRNYLQYFFANNRYMRHPYFHKAVMSSYENLIPEDTEPNYFLRFTVDPDTIDVNIHPTKTEIKFENAVPIWQILAATVKEGLGKFSEVPTIDFDNEGMPKIPVFKNGVISTPDIGVDPSYNPFKPSGKSTASAHGTSLQRIPTNWEDLYANFTKDTTKPASQDDMVATNPSLGNELPALNNDIAMSFDTMCMQLQGRYILSPTTTGVMIIDQHRAHMAVIYNQYMKEHDAGGVIAERILFPELLHLTQAQSIILDELQPEMQKMGFDLAKFSGSDWSLNGTPPFLDSIVAKQCIIDVIDSITNGGETITQAIYKRIALQVAKKAAINYGRILKQEEMDKLLADLFSLPNAKYTPDGKRIITIIKYEDINKMFN